MRWWLIYYLSGCMTPLNSNWNVISVYEHCDFVFLSEFRVQPKLKFIHRKCSMHIYGISDTIVSLASQANTNYINWLISNKVAFSEPNCTFTLWKTQILSNYFPKQIVGEATKQWNPHRIVLLRIALVRRINISATRLGFWACWWLRSWFMVSVVHYFQRKNWQERTKKRDSMKISHHIFQVIFSISFRLLFYSFVCLYLLLNHRIHQIDFQNSFSWPTLAGCRQFIR